MQNESPPFSSSLAYECHLVGCDLTDVTLAEEDARTGVEKILEIHKYFQEYFFQQAEDVGNSVQKTCWEVSAESVYW